MAILSLFIIFLCLHSSPSWSSPVTFSVHHPQQLLLATRRTRSSQTCSTTTSALSSLSRIPVCLVSKLWVAPRFQSSSRNRRIFAGGNARDDIVFQSFEKTRGSPPSSSISSEPPTSSLVLSSSSRPEFSPSSSPFLSSTTEGIQSCSLCPPTLPGCRSNSVLAKSCLSFYISSSWWRTLSGFSSPVSTFITASSSTSYERCSAGLPASVPWAGFLPASSRVSPSPIISPLSSPSSPFLTRLQVYRNKVRHINPVRRVKHLRRNSGQTHVHELARERYLLHRQKDVRDYCRLMLSPHQHLSPSSCPHSQRNAAIKHPYRGANEARKKEFARLNREDDARDASRLEALKAFLDHQKRVLLQTQADPSESSSLEQAAETEEDRRILGENITSAYEALQQLLKKRRMLRPLGSNKLFICNVDGRLANSDLEDFFDFFFEPTQVRLHKNTVLADNFSLHMMDVSSYDGHEEAPTLPLLVYLRLRTYICLQGEANVGVLLLPIESTDGSHRGSGIIRFPDTLQATQCLLDFNGIRLGEKNIFLAEALGPPLQKKKKKTYPRPPFPNGIASM